MGQWRQHGDHRDVETTWGQCGDNMGHGDHGDVETMWRQHGDNVGPWGCGDCHVIKKKGMVFRYMWVYSKEDTMAHTYRAVDTS